jgi:uncharacterized membrane protein
MPVRIASSSIVSRSSELPAIGADATVAAVRRLFGPFFVGSGILHFLIPRTYEAIVPDYLPAKRELVYASGVAEIAGGAALLHPRTRRAGAWWSIATLVAVFPANLHMALNPGRYEQIPRVALWLRLPFQALFIAWATAARR